MALVPCTECGKSISDRAFACPQCGAPTAGDFVHPSVSIRGHEWRTEAELFGLPLIHVALGGDLTKGRTHGVAKGIIAIGDVAFGVLALGGAAFGGVTFGGFSLGLASVGGAAIGVLLGIGGFAIGYVALGGLAIGYYALGGLALGAHTLSPRARTPKRSSSSADTWVRRSIRSATRPSDLLVPTSHPPTPRPTLSASGRPSPHPPSQPSAPSSPASPASPRALLAAAPPSTSPAPPASPSARAA